MEEKLVNEEEQPLNENKKIEEVSKKDKKNENNVKEKKEPKNNKKKIAIICIVIAILVVIGIIMSTIFAFININNEKIVNGVSISGINVSGLSKEEAKTKIENAYIEKKQKEINLKYQEYENTLNPTLLEVEYDVNKAIEIFSLFREVAGL